MPPLRVHILGTRGNVPPSGPRYRRHAGVLVDDRILLDLGDPIYLRRHPECVFISHLHPDHAAFPPAGVPPETTAYLPEPTRALPTAKVIRRAVTVGDCRVVPIPTVHSHTVRSLGFLVEKGTRRLFYSSDLVTIEPRHRRRLGRLDLVITDGSFIRRGGLVRRDPVTGEPFGHAGIPDLVELFRVHTDRIVIMHFGSWFYADIPRGRRRIAALGNGVRVRAAFDGMVIEV